MAQTRRYTVNLFTGLQGLWLCTKALPISPRDLEPCWQHRAHHPRSVPRCPVHTRDSRTEVHMSRFYERSANMWTHRDQGGGVGWFYHPFSPCLCLRPPDAVTQPINCACALRLASCYQYVPAVGMHSSSSAALSLADGQRRLPRSG